MSETAPRRVLFVDDQESYLDGTKLMLQPIRGQWTVETAQGGRAGLAALQAGRFDAVVTSARMNELGGEEILNLTRERHPDAIRVVLSGEMDVQLGRRLTPLAHQFVARPAWGWAAMAAIDSAQRSRRIVTEPSLMRAIESTGNLPMAPRTYHRLSAMIESGNAGIEEISAVVSESIALSATLLRLVGSAYFAVNRPVTSVQEALTLLGLETVQQVVLLMEVFPDVDPFGLFQHVQRDALYRSRLARLVAGRQAVGTLVSEAALLADVGIYVLAMRLPESYRPLWSRARREGVSIRVLEQELLGFSHEQVGAALLHHWKLPQSVVTAVATGHDAPPRNAKVDSSTIQAFTILLEQEARGVADSDAKTVDQLALQLGMAPRLPELRAWARKHWQRVE